MEEIKVSEGPTIRQMLNMASNLREKFQKHSSFSITCRSYSKGDTEYSYNFYVEGTHSDIYKSWPELFTAYTELMER